MRKTAIIFSSLFCLSLVGFLATDALADDIPKRKPGLWEIQGQIEGMPDMGPMQECVDQNTDNLLQQESRGEGAECKTPVVKRLGDTITIYTECKLDEETVTSTDYNLQGSFESAYRGTMTSQIKSPGSTHKTTFTISAKWIGPCTPGQ